MTVHIYQNDLPETVVFKTSVAIDTETMGLNLLRDRLCLVQLSGGDGTVHIVQFRSPEEYSKAVHLKALLENAKVLKIFHFARFDLAILKKNLQAQARSVYCTKIASKLTRTSTDRHGLKDLTKELVGVEISKQQQSSDWGAFTLSEAQLSYAAADVLYLHAIKARLDTLLKREGRLSLAEECFNFLPHRADLDLLSWCDENDIFNH
jgi:ribonuclease D